MSGTELKQRLAAILAADVAGYSRLMAADERATVAALDAARAVFRTQVESNHGRVIDMAGDSVLAVFETATGAVSAALAVQQELNVLSSAVPEDRRMCFRIGVHMGDVIEKADGTIYGDGVNIAARLEGLAEPGGITVSASIRIAVKGKVSAGFEDQGEQTVKNIPDPVRAYRINLAGATASKSNESGPVQPRSRNAIIAAVAGVAFVLAAIGWFWHTSQNAKVSPSTSANDPSASQRSALSIMVLPFANGTGDPQQAYIADGLTASVTSDLARIRDAFVVAAATAFTYKDKPVTLQQVGKDLGVRFVLQGNVQRSGDKIRINAQLGDATSNAQLWSESFDGDQSDLFALQDQVTTRIANSIGREMVIVAARESDARTSSPKVADLMLRAAAVTLKPQSVKKYREWESLSRSVLVLEPNNPRAMVGLSIALALLANNFPQAMDKNVREKMFLEARDLALKAKELDPDDSRVYLAISIFAESHGDFAGARRAMETRLLLDPKNVGPYNNLAGSFLEGGEPQKAIELLTKAIKLDPKHPTSDMVMVNMGSAYFMLGDNDAAIDWYLRSLERNPAFPDTYAFLAMAYALKGDEAKARAAVADLRRVDPNFKLTRPGPSSIAGYKEYFEKKELPAWRKAGLPE